MDRANTKVLIAIPSGDSIPVMTVSCIMNLEREPQDEFQIMTGSLVYNSRTHLVNAALADNSFTHVLFIDSDMTFPPDTLNRLIERDKDVVTCICFGRVFPFLPCAYKRVRKGGAKKSGTKIPIDVTADMPELFQVDGCGSAMILIKTEVFTLMYEKIGKWYEPQWNLGEDLAFTERLKALNIPVWCDSTIPIGHIGQAVCGKETYLSANKGKIERQSFREGMQHAVDIMKQAQRGAKNDRTGKKNNAYSC